MARGIISLIQFINLVICTALSFRDEELDEEKRGIQHCAEHEGYLPSKIALIGIDGVIQTEGQGSG